MSSTFKYFVAGLALVVVAVSAQEAVYLRDVNVLHFKQGRYALNTRGGDPIPELVCTYNPMNDPKYLPTDVICENKGLDDKGGIIWKCEGDMDNSLLFDNLRVSCEGFSGPGDQYIKRGSCALVYSLKLSSSGEQKMYNGNNQGYNNGYNQGYNNGYNNGIPAYQQPAPNNQDLYSNNILRDLPAMKIGFSTCLLFVLMFFALLKACFWCFSDNPRNRQNPQPNQYGYPNNGYANPPPPPGYGGSYSQSSGYGYDSQMGQPPPRRSWLNWGIPLGSFFLGRWSANRPLHNNTYQVPPTYNNPNVNYNAAPRPQQEGSRTERRTGVADTVTR